MSPPLKKKDIPPQAKIRISPPNEKPIELPAAIHYSNVKEESPGSDVELEVVVSALGIPRNWLHQTIHLTILMRPIRKVALIDRTSALSKDGESKILLLSPSGTIHWQKYTNVPVYDDKLVIRGADPKTFRVAIPEKPEILNRAIAFGVKPSIRGS